MSIVCYNWEEWLSLNSLPLRYKITTEQNNFAEGHRRRLINEKKKTTFCYYIGKLNIVGMTILPKFSRYLRNSNKISNFGYLDKITL